MANVMFCKDSIVKPRFGIKLDHQLGRMCDNDKNSQKFLTLKKLHISKDIL